MSGGWWFRVDGDFVENPKIMDLTDRGFRLYMAGLCYSTRNLTDGFLSDRAVKVVCALTAATRRHIVELRDANLWVPRDDGFEINDYGLYQPPAEELKDLRDKRRAAGRKGGLKSGESRRQSKQVLEASASASATPNRSKHRTVQDKEPKAVTSLVDAALARSAGNSPGFGNQEHAHVVLVKEMPA